MPSASMEVHRRRMGVVVSWFTFFGCRLSHRRLRLCVQTSMAETNIRPPTSLRKSVDKWMSEHLSTLIHNPCMATAV